MIQNPWNKIQGSEWFESGVGHIALQLDDQIMQVQFYGAFQAGYGMKSIMECSIKGGDAIKTWYPVSVRLLIIPSTEKKNARLKMEEGIHAHFVLHWLKSLMSLLVSNPNVQVTVVTRIGSTCEAAIYFVTLWYNDRRGCVEYSLSRWAVKWEFERNCAWLTSSECTESEVQLKTWPSYVCTQRKYRTRRGTHEYLF